VKKGEKLAKRGRPKTVNKAKNRVISIVLNEKAALIFRKIKTFSEFNGKRPCTITKNNVYQWRIIK